jgi:putative ABC transport system substrate-binding protein
MNRREFISFVALAAVIYSRPSPSVGQQQKGKRLGWLAVAPHPLVEAFRSGMAELGWVEGVTFEIDFAYADGRPERLAHLVSQLIQRSVDVIVASGSDAVVQARAASQSTPVVAITSGAALAERTKNLSGIALQFDEIAAKWVELIIEAVPQSARLGIVSDGSITNQEQLRTVSRAASMLGRGIVSWKADSVAEVRTAIGLGAVEKVAGLIFLSSPIFSANAAPIAALVAQARLPAIYDSRAVVEKGGLMSYGADLNVVFRRAAVLVDRILKGTPIVDIPIEQPTKFVFAINLRTAKGLGWEVPPQLLARADEVIE